MAKTKPTGVRFDQDLLDFLAKEEKIDSPQKALNFLTEFYRQNQPGKKELIETMKRVLPKLNAPKKAPLDDEPSENGLSKSQLEIRKKKLGF